MGKITRSLKSKIMAPKNMARLKPASDCIKSHATQGDTKEWESKFVKVGASTAQGYREHMEDTYTVFTKLPGSTKEIGNDLIQEISYFGVYDGHAGKKVSQYASKHLHKNIMKQNGYSNGHLDEAITNGIMVFD